MAFLVWSWVGGILLVAVLGLRLYGSLCLLRRKARARVWLLIYAGGMLAIQGFAATCILICGPIHSHAFCIETGWLLIPSMVFATWPTILLLLLKWPGVQAQMAAWPGGPNYGKRPRPEGQAAHTTAPAPCPPEARPPEWWKQWDA
ncbi:MAG: hypothetical protein NTV86_23840 [Planctomycetota bacterium]|nr:hypothetical protein [Planctomycetota bacterium]